MVARIKAATHRIHNWKSEQQPPSLPIVAPTAGAYETDRNRYLATGIDDFMSNYLSREPLRRYSANT